MPPAQVNDSGRAMMARTAEFRDDTSGLLVTAGTSTAYTVTTNQGLPSTPNDGQLLVVTLHTAPGANPTLSADGGTAFPMMINASLAVGAGSIASTAPVFMRFRAASSQWILLYAGGASIAASVIAGSVPNAGLANAPAWTFKGNPTGSSATPTDFTIDSITAKASPLAADEVPIWDAAGAAMKKATLTSLATLISSIIGVAPTVQSFTSGSGTYTPSAGIARSKVRMVGGGGNAGGGTSGSNTSFGTWTAVGGSGGGGTGGTGGAGGSGGTNGTGTLVFRANGGQGGSGGTGGADNFGGTGGGTFFGSTGAPSNGGSIDAPANSGVGGCGTASAGSGNAGGGGGEYVEFWMTAAQIGASLSYTVGAGGTGGTGQGAAGRIIVEEFYI
jgi:hypothetical protein